MVAENQSQETSPISSQPSDNSHSNASVNANTGVQSKDSNFADIDHTPKVRKPYTITKQREKWTEEEHQKFLEALKLYGRAWRQIEEHVGTKTAVQIRSHAQKFFSKVTREGNGSNEGYAEPIEIPPPRPKRKPMHPYPRKCVDFPMRTESFPSQDEQGACSNLLATPQRTDSPTSVLSAAASPVLESPVSEQKNCGLSHISCKTGQNLINLSPVKKLDKGMRNSSPEGEEKSFMLQAEVSACSAVDNPSMKLDPEFKDTKSAKGDATLDSPSTIIKLFGQTVLVTDTNKPATLASENNMTPFSFNGTDDASVPNPVHPLSQLNTQILLGMSHYNWEPWSRGAAEFNSGESFNNDPNSTVVMTNASIPWLTVYPSLPAPCPYNQSFTEERLKDKDISCTGSNNGSTGEVENGDKNSDAADSKSPAEKSPSSHKQTKGFVPYKKRSMDRHAFVPYKRCLVEDRDVSSRATEEREGQGVRVCL